MTQGTAEMKPMHIEPSLHGLDKGNNCGVVWKELWEWEKKQKVSHTIHH